MGLFGNLFGEASKASSSLFDDAYKTDAPKKTEETVTPTEKSKTKKKEKLSQPVEKKEATPEKRKESSKEQKKQKSVKSEGSAKEKRPRGEQDAVRIEPEEIDNVPQKKNKKAKDDEEGEEGGSKKVRAGEDIQQSLWTE